MWTANIVEIRKNLTTIDAVVEFLKDGKFHSSFVFLNADLNTLKTPVANRINELQNIDNFDYSSVLGQIDLTVSPPAPPVSSEDQAKQVFIQDYAKLQSIQKAIDAGLLNGSEKEVLDLQDKVKSEYLPTYIDII